MIYTMGQTPEGAEASNYPAVLGDNEKFLNMLFGYCETLYSYNGYQFSDYSRYDVLDGVEERRAKYRDEQFPIDLQNAYELGKRLVEKTQAG